MADELAPKQQLLSRIHQKRSEIRVFLETNEARNRRLVNTAIFASAIAAAFTAGPAFGGSTMTAWLTETFGLASPAWQLLCLGATVCSVAAAITTNLSKSHDLGARIAQAQACDAKLEGLETLIELNQVDIEEATAQYAASLSAIAFL